MALETTQPGLLPPDSDRRRIPRYSCSGHARIACLPLNGTPLSGRLRDVGLGGCCIESIETPSRIDVGAKTEILMEVNSWFFRAMGHVKALRDRSGISIEFMRMSAGGYSMLAGLVADLERPRSGIYSRQPLRPVESNRFGASPDRSRSNLVLPSQPPFFLNDRINDRVALVGTILPPDRSEKTPAADRYPGLRDFNHEAVSVDIFA